MRNIPVDTSALSFVCVAAPRPKLVDQDTGEVKVDRDGQTVFQVGLSAANESGRVELINVAVSGDPGVQIGQIVMPIKLTAFPWEQTRNGVTRSGVAYRADSVTTAIPADQAAA
ncbi:hypothetical protein GCM10027176_31270 [Actinoallomurus bryophytorum]|uniref:Regulatory protein n=1 Tax=Actinoallomurus bryophytorum TaxID=1490222 RepID=A0A543CGA1_9ACTN|nr:hypothetical protein [Actinoallomurus bryophytorum]TQL96020.1 hypothetical protein FB559_1537 [Actinoallomurus bryophytorum]